MYSVITLDNICGNVHKAEKTIDDLITITFAKYMFSSSELRDKAKESARKNAMTNRMIIKYCKLDPFAALSALIKIGIEK